MISPSQRGVGRILAKSLKKNVLRRVKYYTNALYLRIYFTSKSQRFSSKPRFRIKDFSFRRFLSFLSISHSRITVKASSSSQLFQFATQNYILLFYNCILNYRVLLCTSHNNRVEFDQVANNGHTLFINIILHTVFTIYAWNAVILFVFNTSYIQCALNI